MVFKDKDPKRRIYIYLNHPMGDPVQEAAVERNLEFLSSTFWKNSAALGCQLDAMSLALHGGNVDRVFWTMGPGGVGQSLLTTHIHGFYTSSSRV